uniref:NAD-dependent epimerase/dehydratase family protein n=1 Tax=Altererythrobacter segetis TaxID=1104773 RepID=UPI001FAFDCE0|nr:NAD-dependent epimerase/dehydratase family protein [Altererythrobacter segetis]
MQIAITGANGFIGSHLVRAILGQGDVPVAINRTGTPSAEPGAAIARAGGDCSDAQLLAAAFAGCSCVVHLADSPLRHRKGLSAHTAADRAAAIVSAMQLAGTSRIIYASSIYARPGLRSASVYGQSKSRAEDVFAGFGFVVPIILRLPPVYGEGGGGGYALLERAVRCGLPLPFSNMTAHRSYLDVQALSRLILHLLALSNDAWDRVAAAGPIEPSDGPPMGTADLVRTIAAKYGRQASLFPLPTKLGSLGRLVGFDMRSLSRPLVAQDPQEVEQITGWRADAPLSR